MRDLKYAVRTLLKSPGFALVAILTLTFAIGANALIFSLVNSVLLKPLDFPDSDRLYRVFSSTPEDGDLETGSSYPRFETFVAHQEVFTSLSASVGETFALTGTNAPEELVAQRVSADFFATLGVVPHLGRSFLEEEDVPGAPRVAMLSYGFWQTRFGGDSEVLDRTVELDGVPHTVIGILPKTFGFPYRNTQVWVTGTEEPKGMTPDSIRTGSSYLIMTGRLRDGVSRDQAHDHLARLVAAYQEEYADNMDAGFGFILMPLKEELVGQVETSYYLLLAAVGFVLLIACANVANLVLARMTGRRREIALRTALGASQVVVLRQFIVESLALTVPAAILGVIVADSGLRGLLSVVDNSRIPRADEIGVDPRVLLFTLAVTLLTGLLLGLAPIFQLRRTQMTEVLKEGSRGTGGGQKGERLKSLLVTGEVALSIALLIASGLMMMSFFKLRDVDTGFDPDGLTVGFVNLPSEKYPGGPEQAIFYRELIEKLEALPMVSNATLAMGLPFTESYPRTFYAVEGETVPELTDRSLTGFRMVMPGYFETLGATLKAGRPFVDADAGVGQVRVVIVNETFARHLFGDENAVGRRLIVGRTSILAEIVGVVEDVHTRGLGTEAGFEVYFPFFQGGSMALAVRSNMGAEALIPEIRQVLKSIDSNLPLRRPQPMEELISRSISDRHLLMTCMGIFGAVAFLLSAIGIYSVISYVVRQRAHEIGLRMALGARASQILQLVIVRGLKLVVVGLVVGVAVAAGTSHLMSSLFFQVSRFDPSVFLPVPIVFLLIGLVACLPPAWRAIRIDPMRTLREE